MGSNLSPQAATGRHRFPSSHTPQPAQPAQPTASSQPASQPGSQAASQDRANDSIGVQSFATGCLPQANKHANPASPAKQPTQLVKQLCQAWFSPPRARSDKPPSPEAYKVRMPQPPHFQSSSLNRLAAEVLACRFAIRKLQSPLPLKTH